MSVSARRLVEHIRDVTEQSAGPRAGDQAARRALGREVLQALSEIDRIARQSSGAPVRGAANVGTLSRVLSAADGTTSGLSVLLSGPTPVVRVAASNTGLIRGEAARNAASVVWAAVGGATNKR